MDFETLRQSTEAYLSLGTQVRTLAFQDKWESLQTTLATITDDTILIH